MNLRATLRNSGTSEMGRVTWMFWKSTGFSIQVHLGFVIELKKQHDVQNNSSEGFDE